MAPTKPPPLEDEERAVADEDRRAGARPEAAAAAARADEGDDVDEDSDDEEALRPPPACYVRHRLPIASGCLAVVTIVAASLYAERAGELVEPLTLGLPAGLGAAAGPTLSFVALGDWGRGGVYAQAVTAETMGAFAAATRAAFVVSVGDNFYDAGVASVDDPQWDASWRRVYVHPGLAALPWYAVLGNHDYRQNVSAQVAYAALQRDARWRMAGLNYTARWRLPGAPAREPRACVAAVFIDTSPLMTKYRDPEYGEAKNPAWAANLAAAPPPEATYAWLDGALADAADACAAVVVVGHHPPYSGGEHGDAPELIARLVPLLEAHGVDAYFAGHDHLLTHLVSPPRPGGNGTPPSAGGLDVVLTGGGSKVRANGVATPETAFLSNRGGFTVHAVNGTHASHAYVDGESQRVLWEVVRRLKPKRVRSGGGGGSSTVKRALRPEAPR